MKFVFGYVHVEVKGDVYRQYIICISGSMDIIHGMFHVQYLCYVQDCIKILSIENDPLYGWVAI